MRENRLSGLEGGATLIPSSLPLSIIQSLRDKAVSALTSVRKVRTRPTSLLPNSFRTVRKDHKDHKGNPATRS